MAARPYRPQANRRRLDPVGIQPTQIACFFRCDKFTGVNQKQVDFRCSCDFAIKPGAVMDIQAINSEQGAISNVQINARTLRANFTDDIAEGEVFQIIDLFSAATYGPNVTLEPTIIVTYPIG